MLSEADLAPVGVAIARKFIARADVVAEQYTKADGTVLWTPRETPWTPSKMIEHLRGAKTYGHYIGNTADQCKVLTFDIDWKATGLLPAVPMDDERSLDLEHWSEVNLREAWLQKDNPARKWMQYNLRTAAHYLYHILQSEFGLKAAVAYSGNKGLHVYGFFEKLVALQTARQIGIAALEASGGGWEKRGVPYESTILHPLKGTMGLSIELFPKQDHVEEGFGNLVRLPLGKNLKNPKHPCFFLDMNAPHAEFKPLDAKMALGLA